MMISMSNLELWEQSNENERANEMKQVQKGKSNSHIPASIAGVACAVAIRSVTYGVPSEVTHEITTSEPTYESTVK
jgi:hypothetical protein